MQSRDEIAVAIMNDICEAALKATRKRAKSMNDQDKTQALFIATAMACETIFQGDVSHACTLVAQAAQIRAQHKISH